MMDNQMLNDLRDHRGSYAKFKRLLIFIIALALAASVVFLL